MGAGVREAWCSEEEGGGAVCQQLRVVKPFRRTAGRGTPEGYVQLELCVYITLCVLTTCMHGTHTQCTSDRPKQAERTR